MRALSIAILVSIIGCTPAKQPTNDPHIVPVGSARATPTPTAPSCGSTGAFVDPEHAEGARIVDVCISGVAQEKLADVRAYLRLKPDKKLTADLLASDLRALWDSGFFDQAEATARSAGPDAVLLFIKLTPRPRITKVSFEHRLQIKDEAVTSAFPRAGAPLSIPTLRTAEEKLREAYALEGWEEATVEHNVVPDGVDGVRVRILVHEGTRSKLGKVTFDGAKGGRETGLRKAIELEDGAPISEERLARAALLANAFYYDSGFLNVRIGDPKRVRGTDGTTAVTFPITEGPIFKLGKIKLKNLDAAAEKDALSSMKVKTGDVFSRTKLISDLASLKAMFSLKGRSITFEPQTELNPKTGIVDLTLAAIESK